MTSTPRFARSCASFCAAAPGALLGAMAPGASAGGDAPLPPPIVIDGRFDDWKGVPIAIADPAGDVPEDAPPFNDIDILSVRITDDPDFLYLLI